MVNVDMKLIYKFGEKFVRGVTYAIDGNYIEDDYSITLSHTKDALQEFDDMARLNGVLHQRGPGVVFLKAVAKEDSCAALYLIKIFGTFILRAIVAPKDIEERVDRRIREEDELRKAKSVAPPSNDESDE